MSNNIEHLLSILDDNDNLSKYFTPLHLSNPPTDYKTMTVLSWLRSETVINNLVNIDKINIQFMVPYNQNQPFENRILKGANSPYKKEYKNYILNTLIPSYIKNLGSILNKHKTISENDYLIMQDRVNKIFRAAIKVKYDMITFSETGYEYISRIFKNAVIEKVPDIGNCYFNSIEKCIYNIYNQNINLRSVLADVLVNNTLEQNKSILKSYGESCSSNKDSIYGQLYKQSNENYNIYNNTFINDISKNCKPNEFDCTHCIWGGDYLNQTVSNIYDNIVISFSLTRNMIGKHSYNIANFLPESESDDSDTLVAIKQLLDNGKYSRKQIQNKNGDIFYQHRDISFGDEENFDEVMFENYTNIPVTITDDNSICIVQFTIPSNHDNDPNYIISFDKKPIAIAYAGAHINAVIFKDK